jgi:hypothetical protein
MAAKMSEVLGAMLSAESSKSDNTLNSTAACKPL